VTRQSISQSHAELQLVYRVGNPRTDQAATLCVLARIGKIQIQSGLVVAARRPSRVTKIPPSCTRVAYRSIYAMLGFFRVCFLRSRGVAQPG
jgi:hypothetical protein